MKVTIESTDCVVSISIDGKEVPARIWEGNTEAGVPVVCFVTRISPQTHAAEVNAVFARELEETRKAAFAPFARGIDLRFIL
jgi:hypothetical protein